uniref:Uncharacterized protein n=1 Tax=Anguilla anguilla TaxID=7936 RepID=A0A0E9PMK1_ANGAN
MLFHAKCSAEFPHLLITCEDKASPLSSTGLSGCSQAAMLWQYW